MRARVILLGTCHPLQCGQTHYTKEQTKQFRAYMEDLCRTEGVKIIAEEMSHDGLATFGVTTSVACALAKQLDIKHRYLDLTLSERENLNIDDSALLVATFRLSEDGNARELRDALQKISDQVREGVWLARLLAVDIWPALFVCGANHVENMRVLFTSLGIETQIACNDYKP